jgi:type IV pilus assembly protein PilO
MDLNQPVKMPELNQRTLLSAGVAVMAVLTLYLLVRFTMALFTAHSVSAAEMQQRQLQLKAQDLQIAPMRGMDQKLALANQQAKDFEQQRLPATYSAFLTELGKLQKDTGVRQTRVSYTPVPKESGSGLTEIHMEASLMGDYQPLMKFINQMERDKLFFVIRGVTLTGQQGGVVNLRLRANTYLRPGTAADAAANDAANAANAAANADASGGANPNPNAGANPNPNAGAK